MATVPLVVATAVGVSAMGLRLWRTTIAGAEDRTGVLHELVGTTLRESIVSYLRAKAETAVTLLPSDPARSPTGPLYPSALDEIAEDLGEISVAETGYIYVIDQSGKILIHPDPETRGRIIPDVEPVRTQLARQIGYLEYVWQNSFEPAPEPKALYMLPVPRFGWIVSATAYRSEFEHLIDTERLAETMRSLDFSMDAYSVLMTKDGRLIAHPDYAGRSLYDLVEAERADDILEAVFADAEDRLQHNWPARRGQDGRPTATFFRLLPDFGWAVGTVVYLDTLRRPIVVVLLVFGVIELLLISGVILLARRMAYSVADPVLQLAAAATRREKVDGRVIRPETPAEIRALATRFNDFVDRIREQQEEVESREARLHDMLHEKTVLIREIHHRVKNNLQVMASLLSLQRDEVYDPRDAALLERSRERVLSMAMVHEQLHGSEDLALIPFDQYLQQLVGHMRSSYDTGRVDLVVEADEAPLEIERAVPCGLMVNELVTNALQHAFPGAADGTIRVTLRRRAGEYELSVADTGVGMSGDQNRSLGLTLVESLARQLNATVDVRNDDGMQYLFTFPGARGTGQADSAQGGTARD